MAEPFILGRARGLGAFAGESSAVELGLFILGVAIVICCVYWINALEDTTSKYLDSLALHKSLEDIGNYVETMKKTPDFIGIRLEAYHMLRREERMVKVVTWACVLPFEHCKVEDLTSISKESVINLTNLYRKGNLRPYLEFDSTVDYEMDPSMTEPLEKFRQRMWEIHNFRDKVVTSTVTTYNPATIDYQCINMDNRKKWFTNGCTMTRPFAFCAILWGCAICYKCYFERQTSEAKLIFKKHVSLDPSYVAPDFDPEAPPMQAQAALEHSQEVPLAQAALEHSQEAPLADAVVAKSSAPSTFSGVEVEMV